MGRESRYIRIDRYTGEWAGTQELPSLEYLCWNCNTRISSNRGYAIILPTQAYIDGDVEAGIYLCHRCGYPTFLLNGKQIPGAPFGQAFKYVPNVVNNFYNEARNCYAANAFTAVVLLCRKILMHIGVERGAERDKSFKYYIDYLKEKNLITATSYDWVDKIRKIGNQANHELIENSKNEAQVILTFTSMILATIYEYPEKAKHLS